MTPQTSVRILIIDDDLSMTRALASLLGRDGYTVQTAANGQLALALLHEQRFDVILCDLRMPELDGADFYVLLLRRSPSLCQRVIFLTGDILHAERMAFLEQCGRPWMPKPCTADDVRNAIAQLLRTIAP